MPCRSDGHDTVLRNRERDAHKDPRKTFYEKTLAGNKSKEAWSVIIKYKGSLQKQNPEVNELEYNEEVTKRCNLDFNLIFLSIR